jgi:hypothetical protein
MSRCVTFAPVAWGYCVYWQGQDYMVDKFINGRASD